MPRDLPLSDLIPATAEDVFLRWKNCFTNLSDGEDGLLEIAVPATLVRDAPLPETF
jgi:hypothetical protein